MFSSYFIGFKLYDIIINMNNIEKRISINDTNIREVNSDLNSFKNGKYEIDGEKTCLDKDILFKHNKIYSPDTCVFVPQTINNLFTKTNKKRGEYPIGVSYYKRYDNYTASMSVMENGIKKHKTLGYFNTPEDAFQKYKLEKEKYIKDIAEKYKDKISNAVYNALINYNVEITD